MVRKGAAETSRRKTGAKKPVPSKEPRKVPSLRERRARARNMMGMLTLLLALLFLGAIIYGLWRPEVRITEVRFKEIPDEHGARQIAQDAVSGTYAGIVPRDSIFFYPEKEMRAAFLDTFPSLESVSVSRNSFHSLVVEGEGRVAAFFWCGETAEAVSLDAASCYEADAGGLVFAPLASTTDAHDPSMLRIYTSLMNADVPSYPIRGVVSGAEHLSNILSFVGAVKELGIPVLAALIAGDEAELFITPETRIKFILGEEDEAAKSAAVALKDLNLLNGSIEYVDLRFPGKLYIKRHE